MKTYRAKSNFIAKPPARVQAMAKKYGTLGIKSVAEPPDPYGPNMLDPGLGTFAVDTEGFVSGGSTMSRIPEGDGALQCIRTGSSGAYNYMRASGDLATNPEDGKTYVFQAHCRQSGGSYNLTLDNGVTTAKTLITNSANEWHEVQIVKEAGQNILFSFENQTVGLTAVLLEYKFKEVL